MRASVWSTAEVADTAGDFFLPAAKEILGSANKTTDRNDTNTTTIVAGKTPGKAFRFMICLLLMFDIQRVHAQRRFGLNDKFHPCRDLTLERHLVLML